jgi:signal transduction histidine kinase
MSLFRAFSQRLYLRIWLAVVGGVAVLTLLVGWAWRIAAEQNSQAMAPPPREIVLRNATGEPLLAGQAMRLPGPPEEGITMRIEAADGNVYHLQMSPRRERGGPGGPHRSPEAAFWLRPPFGFLWMLGLVSLAVVVGVFPIIRRLLQRLEMLQRSVQRFGEGDLSVRVPEGGQDEVADLARQFNASAARIEALMTAHKSLLANASHELRSPLTRIRMGLELMGAGNAPSPAFRQEIERNITELDQLIDEILLASRLDAREADMGTLEAIDLVGLAAEECARVGAELDIAPDAVTLEARGVAKLLRRAVRNLLENARRYSQGEITLHITRDGSTAVLRVCDLGPGVPPDQRERIFEPFYRLPGASEREGGVGLGLALVRSIAQRHGGSAHCTDRTDGQPGACFVLALPLALWK